MCCGLRDEMCCEKGEESIQNTGCAARADQQQSRPFEVEVLPPPYYVSRMLAIVPHRNHVFAAPNLPLTSRTVISRRHLIWNAVHEKRDVGTLGSSVMGRIHRLHQWPAPTPLSPLRMATQQPHSRLIR